MPKRSRGSGSLRYNAPRGRYEAVLVVGGTKHTKTVPSPEPNEKRKKEAEAELARLIRIHGDTTGKRYTVRSFLEEWLEFIEPPRTAYLTWRNHKSRVEAHIVPTLGKLDLAALTVKDVDSLLTKLSKQGYSAVTVAHVRKTLHAAIAQAERWEHVTSNPVSLTQAPRQQHAERTTLSPQQALKFLEHVHSSGDRLEALWNIATCLGLRSSEVRGLTWEAIRGNVLHVYEALGMEPGEWKLHEPKTQNGRRSMELPEYIAEQLKERREAQILEEESLGYSNPMGLIFTTPDGYPLSGQWLRMRLHALLTEAELPIIAFHDLRHAAVSLMLARGIPVRLVQQVIGHKSIQITLGVYAHTDAEQRGQARQNLEDWRRGS